jgi:hypothetical protein
VLGQRPVDVDVGVGAQDVGQQHRVGVVRLAARGGVPLPVAGDGHRVDRIDRSSGGTQRGNQQPARGLDGDRDRVLAGIAGRGQHVGQLGEPLDRFVNPPLRDQFAVLVDDGDVMVALGLAGRQMLAAEILGGRQAGIRIDASTLMFFDLDSRELLRTRPNPFTPDQIRRLRGVRPAGPPPRPVSEPIRVQRRASNTGVVMVCGQKVVLGRIHAHQTLTINLSETTLAIELDEQEVRNRPKNNHPAGPQHQSRPALPKDPSFLGQPVKHQVRQKGQGSTETRHGSLSFVGSQLSDTFVRHIGSHGLPTVFPRSSTSSTPRRRPQSPVSSRCVNADVRAKLGSGRQLCSCGR